MAPIPDESLMARVAQGDEAAYTQLMDRHLARQVAFAVKILGSVSEAEDVVQDAFLKVWIKAAFFDARRAKFSTWLYRIVMNQCLDKKRKKSHARLDETADIIDDSPDGEALIMQKSSDGQIQSALAALPPRQRAAVALCYFDGMSNVEAAAIMNVGVKALESLLSRARARLKTTLSPMRDDL